MYLIGDAVKHEKFGKGVISGQTEKTITVEFAHEEKMFIYPDAFIHFLTLKDTEKQEEIISGYKQRVNKDKVKQIIKQEQWKREEKLRDLKITGNSQAVFNVDADEAEDIITKGEISSGSYISGSSKGSPKIPGRMRPNSACLITTVQEDAPERERKIVGIFMVDEEFYGDRCLNGIIKGHHEYRFILPEDCRPLYWDCVEHCAKIPRWGSSSFKYMSNEVMRDIIFKLDSLLRDSSISEEFRKFCDYYCKINHCDTEAATA